jgi:imidazolonepropionase-like amidohydrolase
MTRLSIVSFLFALVLASSIAAQDGPITIAAGVLLDGKGGLSRDAILVVEGAKIARLGGEPVGTIYDLSKLTVLPGLIDAHVHITSHFGKGGRYDNEGESPAQYILFAVENAYRTLMAGFTTVQSIGAPQDLDLRDAIARGALPGPRILTSIRPANENTGTPEELRAFVRKVASEGADLIKLFASKSIREGGGQTMTDAQLQAACDEARKLGLRTWVHAHAASAMKAAALAGCTAVTHGSQATDEVLKLMAERGTFFEPNIGLVSQNYLAHKPQYLGLGNYTEEGFAFMERNIPVKLDMYRRAMAQPGLKLVMGTDATAGAHGRNAEEIIYRIEKAGQKPRDAIAGATSMAAQSLGLQDVIGSLAPGMEADVIAIEGNPLEDATALRRVRFVMKAGKVYRSNPPP